MEEHIQITKEHIQITKEQNIQINTIIKDSMNEYLKEWGQMFFHGSLTELNEQINIKIKKSLPDIKNIDIILDLSKVNNFAVSYNLEWK